MVKAAGEGERRERERASFNLNLRFIFNLLLQIHQPPIGVAVRISNPSTDPLSLLER